MHGPLNAPLPTGWEGACISSTGCR